MGYESARTESMKTGIEKSYEYFEQMAMKEQLQDCANADGDDVWDVYSDNYE